ncbi:hypothetical protein MOBT1_003383 [Malassezia obtusa]|uniref:Protein SMG7 n=1 Tax=Malassezia obtusa TaxID=76774 RepID=A0AAF0IUT7_9BASI|nr:hypothetical protein MOBT1_003383 [Malassezia obtusa]
MPDSDGAHDRGAPLPIRSVPAHARAPAACAASHSPDVAAAVHRPPDPAPRPPSAAGGAAGPSAGAPGEVPLPPRRSPPPRGLLFLDTTAPAAAPPSRAPPPPRRRGGSDAGAQRSRRQRLVHDVHRLCSDLDTLEARMDVLARTDALALYETQKQFLNVSLTLLERLEDAIRTGHARQLPEVHTVLRRTWRTGVERVLEALYTMLAHASSVPAPGAPGVADGVAALAPRFVLLDVLESVLCHTYALCACLYEMATELRVRRACVEWLGDVACRQLAFLHVLHAARTDAPAPSDEVRGRTYRRRSGAPADTPRHRVVLREEFGAWQATAYAWYGLATRDTPDEGHLYTALAQLAGGDDLYALYFYCKSLEVVHPSPDARALMLGFFGDAAQAHRARPDASLAELLVHLHGRLVTRTALDSVAPLLERVAAHLAARGAAHAYAGTRYWMMLALACVSALFEYGRADAYVDRRLLGAYRTPSSARLFSEPSVARLGARLAAPAARGSDGAPGGCAAAALAAGVPPATAHALHLLVQLVHSAAHMQHEALDNPVAHINSPTAFLVVVLSALHILALRAAESSAARTLLDVLRVHFPWATLEAYARADVLGAPTDAACLAQQARAALPEDWCLCGVAWNTHHPLLAPPIPRAGAPPAPAPAPAPACAGRGPFVFSSETHMFADWGAMARHFASLKTHSYLSAYVQDPDLQELLRVRHARFHLLVAALLDAAGPKSSAGAA